MAGRRLPRLNEQLKREITDILRREVRDPRIGGVVVTEARVSRDLSHARVYVTFPQGADADEGLRGLAAAAPFIRGVLGRRLHVRQIPELHFHIDTAIEHGMRIERLLREVLPREDEDGDAGTPQEADAQEDAGLDEEDDAR